jgi:hypothetical protein
MDTPSEPPDVLAHVQALMRDYFDGLYRGDVHLLGRVFHPQAQLFGFGPGSPHSPAAQDQLGEPLVRDLPTYLAVVAARRSPHDLGESFAFRVLSLEVTGPLAHAKVCCPMLGNVYLDHLTCAMCKGRWQITHKAYVHAPAWAHLGT